MFVLMVVIFNFPYSGCVRNILTQCVLPTTTYISHSDLKFSSQLPILFPVSGCITRLSRPNAVAYSSQAGLGHLIPLLSVENNTEGGAVQQIKLSPNLECKWGANFRHLQFGIILMHIYQ